MQVSQVCSIVQHRHQDSFRLVIVVVGKRKKENEFDEKKYIRSRRTSFRYLMFVIFFFLSSLSSIGEGAVSSRELVFVAVVGFS